jgi:hypothetical protein
MTRLRKCTAIAAFPVWLLAQPAGAAPATAIPAAQELATHRAVYELTLKTARGNSAPSAARGRILYDFSGNACEGYVLKFRQVSELDQGEGKIVLSDLRSTTWEDGEAKTFRFNSENYVNEKLIEAVIGHAQRLAAGVAVTLTKPGDRKIDLAAPVVFPTEHMRLILSAAREGKTILEVPVYDGADTGTKIYNTLTVIGAPIPPDKNVPTDATVGQRQLAGMKRWPVTISYFDGSAKPGDQEPLYAISFETYENGISRALVLDYNTFSISGEMTRLEITDSKPCK